MKSCTVCFGQTTHSLPLLLASNCGHFVLRSTAQYTAYTGGGSLAFRL
jgi:hypothetical protein